MPKNDSVLPAPKVIPAVPAVPPTGIACGKMHQNGPNGASIALYVPAAQQQRIVQLRQMGKSVREIARREKRHRRTINKVLWYNADQMREYNEQSQAGETKLPASWLCPHCGGAMVLIEKFTAQEIRSRLAEESHFVDSS